MYQTMNNEHTNIEIKVKHELSLIAILIFIVLMQLRLIPLLGYSILSAARERPKLVNFGSPSQSAQGPLLYFGP